MVKLLGDLLQISFDFFKPDAIVQGAFPALGGKAVCAGKVGDPVTNPSLVHRLSLIVMEVIPVCRVYIPEKEFQKCPFIIIGIFVIGLIDRG